MAQQKDRAAWIRGGKATCAEPPGPGAPWRLVLLGAPGVGKGTQAELLCEHLGTFCCEMNAVFLSHFNGVIILFQVSGESS